MKILAACEWSGRVRDAFRELGHDAWSVDLEQTAGIHTEFAIRGNVLDHLNDGWDMMIAFPPCTYLTNATHIYRESAYEDDAIEFVKTLYDAPIPRIAIENPVGVLSRKWRTPDQIVNPWWFGEPYKKRTCIWLKNLPPLHMSENWEHPDLSTPWIAAGGRSGINRDPKLRELTFKGFAKAMADQWGAIDG